MVIFDLTHPMPPYDDRMEVALTDLTKHRRQTQGGHFFLQDDGVIMNVATSHVVEFLELRRIYHTYRQGNFNEYK
jgi:hypothetical protein